ncbi:MAG: hypothetical protein QOG92_338, partial [Verrucomicrobiota bacterium]|nr:hypothetical protein [Verrucomicrobiota bacterium]
VQKVFRRRVSGGLEKIGKNFGDRHVDFYPCWLERRASKVESFSLGR